MADIEKVLEGLEYCQRREDGSCIGCPGDMECWCDEAIKLLEKQKPKQIERILNEVFGVVGGVCPTCHNWVPAPNSFCGVCGQAVIWKCIDEATAI